MSLVELFLSSILNSLEPKKFFFTTPHNQQLSCTVVSEGITLKFFLQFLQFFIVLTI